MSEESPPTSPILLSGAPLVEYIARRAADTVTEEVRSREERRLRVAGVATGIVGLIAAGVLNLYVDRTIGQEVTAQLDARRAELTDTISEGVDGRLVGRLRAESTYFQLAVLASELTLGTGFSQADVVSVRSLVGEIAGSKEIVERPELGGLLEKIIDAMAMAGRRDVIDYIVGIPELKAAISRTPGIGITLAEHYAKRIVVADQSEKEIRDLVRRFLAQVEEVDSQDKSGVVQGFRLLVAFTASRMQDEEGIAHELERARHLEPDQAVVLGNMLSECVKPLYWGAVTFDTTRLASTCSELVETHGDVLGAAISSAATIRDDDAT